MAKIYRIGLNNALRDLLILSSCIIVRVKITKRGIRDIQNFSGPRGCHGLLAYTPWGRKHLKYLQINSKNPQIQEFKKKKEYLYANLAINFDACTHDTLSKAVQLKRQRKLPAGFRFTKFKGKAAPRQI